MELSEVSVILQVINNSALLIPVTKKYWSEVASCCHPRRSCLIVDRAIYRPCQRLGNLEKVSARGEDTRSHR